VLRFHKTVLAVTGAATAGVVQLAWLRGSRVTS